MFTAQTIPFSVLPAPGMPWQNLMTTADMNLMVTPSIIETETPQATIHLCARTNLNDDFSLAPPSLNTHAITTTPSVTTHVPNLAVWQPATPHIQLKQHIAPVLHTLQQKQPSLFGDITAKEVASFMGLISVSEALDVLKQAPFSAFTDTTSSLFTSLSQYLKLDQQTPMDLAQMKSLIELSAKVGAFAVLSLASWFSSGKLLDLMQKAINNSKLSEGKKHFLTQSSKALRIAFVAYSLFFSYILLGGNMNVLLTTVGITALAATVLAKDLAADFLTYLKIKNNPTFQIGNYISCEETQGYVLYTNLTHTILINFYDPDKVDLNSIDSIAKHQGFHIPDIYTHDTRSEEINENEEPSLDEDAELPTADIPHYISIAALARGRIAIPRQVPNAFLLSHPVDHFENRDISNKDELEPYLAVLRKKEPVEKKKSSDDKKNPPPPTNPIDHSLFKYMDMHWMSGIETH